jgi:hypothetical protein
MADWLWFRFEIVLVAVVYKSSHGRGQAAQKKQLQSAFFWSKCADMCIFTFLDCFYIAVLTCAV